MRTRDNESAQVRKGLTMQVQRSASDAPSTYDSGDSADCELRAVGDRPHGVDRASAWLCERCLEQVC